MLGPTRPIQAHVTPGEGEAAVVPAACLATCSVLFVKGQVSPGWLSLAGGAQSVFLPRTVLSLCSLSSMKGETKSEELRR